VSRLQFGIALLVVAGAGVLVGQGAFTLGGPTINAAISALAGLAGALIGSHASTRNSQAGLVQKTNEQEIESIDRRVSGFLMPFIHLSNENRTLAQELKRRLKGDGDFRTLTGLLTTGWRETLTLGEQALLAAVVSNASELRDLIIKGSGSVSIQLLPYFEKASSHFRFLQLAYDGSLDMDPARYERYVYPRQLDGVLAAELSRLEARRDLLRREPARSHERISDLVIPADLRLPV